MLRTLPLFVLSCIIPWSISLHHITAKEPLEIPLISKAFRKVIFPQGEGGSKFFRIPAIITAKNGDLMAVIDARRNTTRDLQHTRNIDIAYKRSTDNGNTWTDIKFMTNFPDG